MAFALVIVYAGAILDYVHVCTDAWQIKPDEMYQNFIVVVQILFHANPHQQLQLVSYYFALFQEQSSVAPKDLPEQGTSRIAMVDTYSFVKTI